MYVRGDMNEDISYCIEKVVFTLHQSFATPVRGKRFSAVLGAARDVTLCWRCPITEITTPPYEVTEWGWGEFEIPITIHFRDSTMKPVTVVQLLKLYPPGNQPSSLTKV